MANISSTVLKITFLDSKEKPIVVDFENKEIAEWKEFLAEEWSYQGGGCTSFDGRFYLCGRWCFQNNLEWTDTIKEIFDRFHKIKENAGAMRARYMIGDYADIETGNDFVGFGKFKLDLENYEITENIFDSVSIHQFVSEHMMEDLDKLNPDTNVEWEEYNDVTNRIEEILSEMIDDI